MTSVTDGQQGRRTRILIVDDDERVRFVVGRALMRLGSELDIVTAGSGREALEQARGGTFDLVLTDLRMPDMDGIQLTEAIRANAANTVVIWMTAHSCQGVAADAKRLGVTICVQKPLEPGAVRRLVLIALDGSAAGIPEDLVSGCAGGVFIGGRPIDG